MYRNARAVDLQSYPIGHLETMPCSVFDALALRCFAAGLMLPVLTIGCAGDRDAQEDSEGGGQLTEGTAEDDEGGTADEEGGGEDAGRLDVAGTDVPGRGGDGPCYEPSEVVNVGIDTEQAEACAVWHSLDALPGQATMSRSGMDLTIDFGDGVEFSGTVNDPNVGLTYAHDHPYEDNCVWRATETLQGTFDPLTCAMTLTYRYEEAVAEDRGDCYSPCFADGEIEMTLTPVAG